MKNLLDPYNVCEIFFSDLRWLKYIFSSKNPEEAELEDTLNQVMVVFKYIEDKDVFQKFYSKMLAKRLVQHMSASDDAEASMISKLKVKFLKSGVSWNQKGQNKLMFPSNTGFLKLNFLYKDYFFHCSKHAGLNTHPSYNVCSKM